MSLWKCGSLLQHTAMIIIIIYVILGKGSAKLWIEFLPLPSSSSSGVEPWTHPSPSPSLSSTKPPPSCHQARAQGTGSARCHRPGGRVHPVLPRAVRTAAWYCPCKSQGTGWTSRRSGSPHSRQPCGTWFWLAQWWVCSSGHRVCAGWNTRTHHLSTGIQRLPWLPDRSSAECSQAWTTNPTNFGCGTRSCCCCSCPLPCRQFWCCQIRVHGAGSGKVSCVAKVSRGPWNIGTWGTR